ncbi:MAG: energy transducer TonB [Planctomycetales bacterium]|nr:energy transducer TonB [Planctomycetales bacterium]MCA9169506.1 energy transducer TonB [Planctomycetales bacterium]
MLDSLAATHVRLPFAPKTGWGSRLRGGLVASLLLHGAALIALSQRWIDRPQPVERVVFAGQDRVVNVTATWSVIAPSAVPMDQPVESPVLVTPQEAVIERQHFVLAPTELDGPELDAEPTVELRTAARPTESTPAQLPTSSPPLPRAASRNPVVPRPQVPAPAAQTNTSVASVAKTVGSADVPPSFANNRPPKYPEVAVRRHWEGTVLLRVRIDATGRVEAVEVAKSSGYPMLDAEAVSAVRQWRAQPARRAGQPAATTEYLPIRFEL